MISEIDEQGWISKISVMPSAITLFFHSARVGVKPQPCHVINIFATSLAWPLTPSHSLSQPPSPLCLHASSSLRLYLSRIISPRPVVALFSTEKTRILDIRARPLVPAGAEASVARGRTPGLLGSSKHHIGPVHGKVFGNAVHAPWQIDRVYNVDGRGRGMDKECLVDIRRALGRK